MSATDLNHGKILKLCRLLKSPGKTEVEREEVYVIVSMQG